MRFFTQILTHNDCYTSGRTITPRGVMVHSTGANNPKLSRYVPGNEEIGYNTGGNHWDQPRQYIYTDGTKTVGWRDYKKTLKQTLYGACVHAFIGKLADGSVGVVQTLPWNRRGWHCASGSKGSANDTHISFEICEDGLQDASYFSAVYQEAVELTADLCKQYGLDPLADGVVICHSEGHARGVASNHADVMHWFPIHRKSMDTFRADVAREMEVDMTQEQFNKMMDTYNAQKAAEEATQPWEQQTIAKAKEAGISDGQRPRAGATRVETMAMILAAMER